MSSSDMTYINRSMSGRATMWERRCKNAYLTCFREGLDTLIVTTSVILLPRNQNLPPHILVFHSLSRRDRDGPCCGILRGPRRRRELFHALPYRRCPRLPTNSAQSDGKTSSHGRPERFTSKTIGFPC